MSDQPTNHRAQAESWLIEAVSHVNHGAEGFAISGALIGIGHWLGAIHDALLAGIDVLAEDEPTFQAGPTTVTNFPVVNNRCPYTETSGGVQLRCDLTPGHPPFLRESGHRLRLNP